MIGWLSVVDYTLDLHGDPLSSWVRASAVMAVRQHPLGGSVVFMLDGQRFQVDEQVDDVLVAIEAGTGELHVPAPAPLPERATPVVSPMAAIITLAQRQRCDDPNCTRCNPRADGASQ